MDELLGLLEELGLDSTDLDELVYEAKDQEAADLNNAGEEAQLAYLQTVLADDELRATLRRLAS